MKRKSFKRIAALAIAVITALSFIPATTAYAAGEAGAITFDYCYDSSGNMILYNGETYVDGYLAEAQRLNRPVLLSCAIGDEAVDGVPYAQIVKTARAYIEGIGGFEKFAEWGLI